MKKYLGRLTKARLLWHFELKVNTARKQIQHKKYEDAKQNVYSAISLIPQLEKYFPKKIFASAYYNLGIAYLRQKDYYKAISFYKKALENDPHKKEALNDIGVSYLLIGKYETSKKHLLKCVNLYPSYYLAMYNLGRVLDKEENNTIATQFLKQEIDFNSKPYIALIYLGSIFYQQKKIEQAHSLFLKAYELIPQNIKSIVYKLNLISELGEHSNMFINWLNFHENG